MLKDSEILYDYLTQDLEIDCENIILLGRSIGSGPATHLATTRKCRALILMSGYTSI
jgi:dienelactone hydrolase